MGDEDLIIRGGVMADLGAVVQLENLSFVDPWTAGALRSELIEDALRWPLVAVCGGVLCGYLMSWRVDRQLHILNIAVDQEFRRRQVGTVLLRTVAARAAACQLVEITLEVRQSNVAAQSFYRKYGLREVGLRAGYYGNDGEDAIIMTGPVAGVLGVE